MYINVESRGPFLFTTEPPAVYREMCLHAKKCSCWNPNPFGRKVIEKLCIFNQCFCSTVWVKAFPGYNDSFQNFRLRKTLNEAQAISSTRKVNSNRFHYLKGASTLNEASTHEIPPVASPSEFLSIETQNKIIETCQTAITGRSDMSLSTVPNMKVIFGGSYRYWWGYESEYC